MSNKQYLVGVMGKEKYRSLPKSLREKIERLDELPAAPKQVTLKQIKETVG